MAAIAMRTNKDIASVCWLFDRVVIAQNQSVHFDVFNEIFTRILQCNELGIRHPMLIHYLKDQFCVLEHFDILVERTQRCMDQRCPHLRHALGEQTLRQWRQKQDEQSICDGDAPCSRAERAVKCLAMEAGCRDKTESKTYGLFSAVKDGKEKWICILPTSYRILMEAIPIEAGHCPLLLKCDFFYIFLNLFLNLFVVPKEWRFIFLCLVFVSTHCNPESATQVQELLNLSKS